MTRVPTPTLRGEASEESEPADDFGADRTPPGILVDRAALGHRSRGSAAAALTSAALALTLGATVWWQAARVGAPASPVPARAAAERAAAPSERPAAPSERATTHPRPRDPNTGERASELQRTSPPVSGAPAEERAPGIVESAPSAAHDVQRLEFALRWARTQAERCHRGGRAVGTAEIAITFSPAGKVTAVHLTGEPIASAPVAHCVASFFQSMLIPAFDGEAFTVHETLTLR